MENKINIAELLKGCPAGMELDCTMYSKVTLLSVDDKEGIIFPIRVLREDGNSITLTKYGQFTDADFAKCVIYPKGKTTWEGFVPPCEFKVGDKVVFDDDKEKPLTIRKMWWDWQAREILCSFEEDDIDVPVKDLDRYIKPKFDITTLKPFDKVLTRDTDNSMWTATLFSHLRGMTFYTVGGWYNHCIPFEGNEHLLGKTDNCNDFYKTW